MLLLLAILDNQLYFLYISNINTQMQNLYECCVVCPIQKISESLFCRHLKGWGCF